MQNKPEMITYSSKMIKCLIFKQSCSSSTCIYITTRNCTSIGLLELVSIKQIRHLHLTAGQTNKFQVLNRELSLFTKLSIFTIFEINSIIILPRYTIYNTDITTEKRKFDSYINNGAKIVK